MTSQSDRLAGIALMAFSIGTIYAASQLRPAPLGYPIGSGTFPTILGWVLAGLSLWLVARKARIVESGGRLLSWRAAVGFALTILYIAVFRQIGFLVCTFALLVAYAMLLQRERLRLIDSVLVPFCSILAVYVLLRILNVPLPRALLP